MIDMKTIVTGTKAEITQNDRSHSSEIKLLTTVVFKTFTLSFRSYNKNTSVKV